MHDTLTRRATLGWLAAIGATGVALPARLALAATPVNAQAQDRRLVVVLLRGALDGLAAVPAPGDPAWSALRPEVEPAGTNAPALRLDNTFSLHPSLAQLHRWYEQRELLVVHATASPYRERSHFDAQQLLESGGERPFVLDTGWLGRALQLGGHAAMAMTAAMPLALRGAQAASTWTPDRRKGLDQDLMSRVSQLYQDDPQLASAFAQAMGQQDMASAAHGGAGLENLAGQAGRFLADPKGPRVAWLETTGWDTHANQAMRLGRLLKGLDDGLASLRQELGAHWANTVVLVLTEFGRSAAFNGTGGTDHGTGGIALVAGGAVAGGKVLTDWPGLSPRQLLDGRDLRPTIDLRAVIAPLVEHQFGLTAAQVHTSIFPNLVRRNIELIRSPDVRSRST